jgi:hypothetical protein
MVKYIKEDAKLTKVGILNDTDAFGAGGPIWSRSMRRNTV